MQITDPIADLLTRIRNANSAKHDTVEIPASNTKKAIANILLEEWNKFAKDSCWELIPAWSLHRLIEMRLAHDPFVVFQLNNTEDAYEKVISHIEHAIKEGYFNKEYLEE